MSDVSAESLPPSTFSILYDVGPVFIVLKPGGLSTQAPYPIESLEVQVRDFLKKRAGKEGNIYLGVPHRLDRPVSGPVAFALNVRAAKRISSQFELRMVQKTYWAAVPRAPESPSGTWTDHMRKIPNIAAGEIVPPDHPEARLAVLHYRTLHVAPWGALLRVELETGRMHQIRIQCAARGLPVLGDFQYGSDVAFGPPTEDRRAQVIALHGRRLAFGHPMTREPIDVRAPLPDYWAPLGLPDGLDELDPTPDA